jgi:site-specific DNA recombinase
MERLIELVHEERVQAVVVYKIDRMFRSVRDALVTFDLFKERHVEFHSVVEKWDTSTAMGEFAMNMLLSIAQLERRQTSERTRFTLREKKTVEHASNPVMRHRKREGKLAVGQAPYGWRWVAKELVPDPAEQQIVREIVQRRHEGAGIGGILKGLNTGKIRNRSGKAWYSTQIYRILHADYNLEQSRAPEELAVDTGSGGAPA